MKSSCIHVLLLGVSLSISLHAQVVGWGSNIAGEATGIPGRGYTIGLLEVGKDNLSKPKAIAAGDAHGLLLREDGTVFGWGWDYFGQATGLDARTQVKTNGPVVLAGERLRDVKAIAAAENLSVALKHDGTVVTWGTVIVPQKGEVALPVNVSNVTAIAAGMDHLLTLLSDGTVMAFGDAVVPAGLSNVVAISASSGIQGQATGQDLALKRDGTVVAWNYDGSGGVVVPAPRELTNVVRVAAGWWHNLALTKDGRVFGWGENGSGQATGVASTNSPYEGSGFVTIAGEMLTNVVEIAAADSYSLALQKDGSILVWGKPSRFTGKWSIPTGLSNVVAIAAGSKFCLAITTNAAVAERFRR